MRINSTLFLNTAVLNINGLSDESTSRKITIINEHAMLATTVFDRLIVKNQTEKAKSGSPELESLLQF